MVGQMKDFFETDVFGVEKEAGKVEGIIAAVYQSVFGQDAYPSLEEKAANLLYFMIYKWASLWFCIKERHLNFDNVV